MAGKDVSLFFGVLLGGDDRAHKQPEAHSHVVMGNPVTRIAMLQFLCMQPAHACGNVNGIGRLCCATDR